MGRIALQGLPNAEAQLEGMKLALEKSDTVTAKGKSVQSTNCLVSPSGNCGKSSLASCY